MTGKPNHNHHAFIAAENHINANSPSLQTYSPHTIVVTEPTWENYMREALMMLLKCQGIYMLKGWRDSKGARIELGIAQELGMRVVYER